MKRLNTAGLVAGIVLLLAAQPLRAAQAVLVETRQGALIGVLEEDHVTFKGIPYAQPVSGDGRWRAPQPAGPWEGRRDGRTFGPACPQPQSRAAPELRTMAEDCLTLNVWSVPGGARLPVIVWLHGGSFGQGGAARSLYDGAGFARQGVVLVSINHRLGPFGFFAHPSLDEGGNFALRDQLLALRWVRDNIAVFGGDPGNVTIAGQGAGGTSALLLLTSPKAKGLFHRAIVQSGGGHQRLPGIETPGAAGPPLRAMSVALVGARASAAELRALDAGRLLAEFSSSRAPFGPVVDGDIVTASPGVQLAGGDFNRVPVLVGSNSAEATVLVARGRTAEDALAAAGLDLRRDAAEVYGRARGESAAAWGDMAFVAGARHVARSVAEHGQPAYLYHFDYVYKGLRANLRQRRLVEADGAQHGAEVGFVFNNLARLAESNRVLRRSLSTQDYKYAERVQAAWARFAATGDPNGEGVPDWPRYSADGDALMLFGVSPRVVTEFRARELDFHQARWRAAVGLDD